jgi:hypothetical protein
LLFVVRRSLHSALTELRVFPCSVDQASFVAAADASRSAVASALLFSAVDNNNAVFNIYSPIFLNNTTNDTSNSGTSSTLRLSAVVVTSFPVDAVLRDILQLDDKESFQLIVCHYVFRTLSEFCVTWFGGCFFF